MEELRRLLARHVRASETTAIDGLFIAKAERSGAPGLSMSGVLLAVLVQGAKRLVVGDRVHLYEPGDYLIASADLPVSGHFVDATPGNPALGMALTLEPQVIAELVLQADLPRQGGSAPAIAVGKLSAELTGSLTRLVGLLDHPKDQAVLAPMIKREIFWRLITGDQGAAVRQLGLPESNLSHVTRAARWIRDNFAEPFRVEDLAKVAGMSESGFYRHFQTVTALSPIQFQKQIRLQEARLLLATEPRDITGVAHRVGYDSASQFSREYRRQYGVPPSQDLATR